MPNRIASTHLLGTIPTAPPPEEPGIVPRTNPPSVPEMPPPGRVESDSFETHVVSGSGLSSTSAAASSVSHGAEATSTATPRMLDLYIRNTIDAFVEADPSGWVGDFGGDTLPASQKDKGDLLYISTSSIESLDGDLKGVDIDVDKVPVMSPERYLGHRSVLGPSGPLGAKGPLGELGAIGDHVWNPSRWFPPELVDTEMSQIRGPLSELGPLGEKGPVSDIYYNAELFAKNDFARHLRGLGLWSVLGPIGPLGALGVLGPLGPVGAHGYARDEMGNYIDTSGERKRSIDVWYDQEKTVKKRFDLYEVYTESHARSMKNNDTSFMVEGSLQWGLFPMLREVDEFEVTTTKDELEQKGSAVLLTLNYHFETPHTQRAREVLKGQLLRRKEQTRELLEAIYNLKVEGWEGEGPVSG